MKKTLLAIALIMIIATGAVFAADSTDSFTITTSIEDVGLMKVSESAIDGHTQDAYAEAGNFTTYEVKSSGKQENFEAYLTVLSNKRTGYAVTMEATAMTSTVADYATSYINYTVECEGQKIITNNSSSATEGAHVVSVPSLATLTGASYPITLSIDESTFAAAVSGSYVGTVTFTFLAD